jgi:hypothetical protein
MRKVISQMRPVNARELVYRWEGLNGTLVSSEGTVIL